MSDSKATATASASGIGFGGLLTIAFIILKLCHVIDWSWLWVLSPLWISVGLTICILLVFALIAFVVLLFKKK
jgi:hypothetical protein